MVNIEMELETNMLKVIDSGTVFEGEKGSDAQSAAFAGICVLPSGRCICGFRIAPTKGGMIGQRAAITWSDENCQTWNTPIVPFEPPLIDGHPGLFRSTALTSLGGKSVLATIYWVDHSNPELDFFNEETEGLLDSRIFLSTSEDEGETWSTPELMDTTPFNIPTPITGPILKLPNGDLACQFELNKHYYDLSEWHHESILMFSKDNGKTWPEHTVASSDPENRFFYWDQRPSVLADGTLLDLFWTFDRKEAVYLNIHARSSCDNGRTWTQLWDTGVAGQPAPAVSLPDGQIGMVYVDRSAEPVIKMRASADDGKTWPDESEITISDTKVTSQTWNKGTMQDAWAEMGAFSIGLPATATLANGDVLVTYYAGPETNHTGIRWAQVRNQ